MAVARGGREFFVTGHSEYSPLTLDTEYRRDLNKGLPIEIPRNYYVDDDPDKGVLVRWRCPCQSVVLQLAELFCISGDAV